MSDTTLWADINNAFGSALKARAGTLGIVVDWENVPAEVPKPVKETDAAYPTMFLRPALITAEPQVVELGPDGQNMEQGIYQVNVFIQAGAGRKPIMDVVNAICTLFKRGTILSSGSVAGITIETVWPSPAIEETDWYMIPVSARWWSYVDNN